MSVTKESFIDIEENFAKIIKLVEGDSKTDPPNDPFRSMNRAKVLLTSFITTASDLRNSQPTESEEFIRLTALLGLTYFYLAKISSNTDTISETQGLITRCLETIDEYKTRPDFIMITVCVLNLQALLNSENELSVSGLEKCVRLYNEFKTRREVAVDLNDLYKVDIPESNMLALEREHTLTLYYLAQTYGILKDSLKSSVYCHLTLKRQLQYNDYDCIDWALNASTLSQFFIEKNCFKQARHHLAASLYILQKCEDVLNAETQRNEEYNARVENFKHRSADVARCWAKYGLALLSTSRERLLQIADDAEFNIYTEFANLNLTDSGVSLEATSKLEFDLDIELYENQITDNFLLTLEDARSVFLNAKSWLSKAQEYYTLNTLASDYINIIQDESQLYLNLLFFDDDPGNQAKLHKRRADLLEDLLKHINPKFYMSYCRSLWYEAAEIYRDIYYIKRDKLQETEGHPAPHSLTKINSLITKSISHYKNFTDSFKDRTTNELPKFIPSEYQKVFLLCYFNRAALNNRFVTIDKKVIREYSQASFDAYKYIVDYCERNSQAVEEIPEQIQISREMINLLSAKIDKLTKELVCE